jgi:Fe-S oxidoreductase
MPLEREARERLAAHAFLVEEWLDLEWDHHAIHPSFAATTESIAFHAHCHQKALWGHESSSRLLGRVFGHRSEVLPTGCCGMAGAFGLDASTASLGRAIAQLDIVPALASRPHHIACASGSSCRHQIRDTSGRRALHPIELIARALAD